jgi:hypothetical protein
VAPVPLGACLLSELVGGAAARKGVCVPRRVFLLFGAWGLPTGVACFLCISSAYFSVPRVPPPHRIHHVKHRLCIVGFLAVNIFIQ